jgi:AcrR family transcriptional regulator
MARWAPDAAGRLQDAALELFERDGFAKVTVGQIAEAAGVTERTFFRYFPTKEDVLFSSGDEIASELAEAVRAAPLAATANELLLAALLGLASTFEPERSHHRLRASVINSEPALRERDLLKQHYLSMSLVEELVNRGTPRARAMSVAGVGMVVFQAAYGSWVTDRRKTTLSTRIESALIDLISDLGSA